MRRIEFLFVFAVATLPSAASAQSRSTIMIGPITSAQDCTLYRGTEGSSSSYVRAGSNGYVAASGGEYANAEGSGGGSAFAAGSSSSYAAGSSSRWRDFFVKECVRHFEGIRTSMQAALAASGKIVVGSGGFTVTGRINSVAAGGDAVSETGSNSMSAFLTVSAEIVVHDRAGRIVYGAPLIAKVETGAGAVAGGYQTSTAIEGDGVFGLLQQQIALAMARKVALHFVPMTVTENLGRSIRLNYGEPLLERGMIVRATGSDGSDVRFQISSVSDGTSLATLYSDGDPSRITAGARADLADPSQSRWEHVELP